MKSFDYNILLADDDEGDRLLFKEALGELLVEANINIVNNGLQLMNYLNAEDVILPNLIFLDLNMPLKNGIACLEEIRSDDKFKDIFIAIYSTSGSDSDINETFSKKANIYIKKPSDFSELIAMLDKAISAAHMYDVGTFNRANFILKI